MVSVGIPVEQLLEGKDSDAALRTTAEFCGGTHLLRAGHIGDFILVHEEAIARGIRRIVALTGPEADKAKRIAESLRNDVDALSSDINENHKEKEVKSGVKDEYRRLTELDEVRTYVFFYFSLKSVTHRVLSSVLSEQLVSRSNVAYIAREELRGRLRKARKYVDEIDKAAKTEQQRLVVDGVRRVIEADATPEGGTQRTYFVLEVDAGSNGKALEAAMKEFKSRRSDAAVFLLTRDRDASRVQVSSTVPKPIVEKCGLRADKWVQEVVELIKGKGGGREFSAQAIGSSVEGADEAMTLADRFAKVKLSAE